MSYPTPQMLKAQECRQILLNCPQLPMHVREYLEARIAVHEAITLEAGRKANARLIELQGRPT